MGWRAQHHYDEAERERERAWLASLPPRERMRVRAGQAFRIAIAVVILGALAFAAFAAPIEPGRVQVIDGDTIRIGGQVYRLVGFDAPETRPQATCDSEHALGLAATRRLRQLVAGGGLTFERMRCACHPGTEGTRACNYGRLCGTLKAGGRDVGAILIAEELARPYICRKTSCPRRESWCD